VRHSLNWNLRMIRLVLLAAWIALILATALTLHVIANWVLTAGLVLYVLRRWHSRRRRIASQLRRHETLSAAASPASFRATRWQ
jgi:thiosulfate reductase cytochrome b subunit